MIDKGPKRKTEYQLDQNIFSRAVGVLVFFVSSVSFNLDWYNDSSPSIAKLDINNANPKGESSFPSLFGADDVNREMLNKTTPVVIKMTPIHSCIMVFPDEFDDEDEVTKRINMVGNNLQDLANTAVG